MRNPLFSNPWAGASKTGRLRDTRALLLNTARSVLFGAFSTILLLATNSWAQAVPTAPVDPNAQATAAVWLNLSANAEREVRQDTIHITLSASIQGRDPAQVGAELSAVLQGTLDAARQAGSELVVRTGNYRVYPQFREQGQIGQWLGQAEIILQSQNLELAAQTAGELASRMPVSNVYFSISRELQRTTEQELLQEAADALRTRADAAARAFGFSTHRLVSVDLDGQRPGPIPMMMRAEAMATGVAMSSAPIPIEAGMSTVSVQIAAQVQLLP